MDDDDKRRITEGGTAGTAFWDEFDAAIDAGLDPRHWLLERGIEPKIVEQMLRVYPNVPKRD